MSEECGSVFWVILKASVGSGQQRLKMADSESQPLDSQNIVMSIRNYLGRFRKFECILSFGVECGIYQKSHLRLWPVKLWWELTTQLLKLYTVQERLISVCNLYSIHTWNRWLVPVYPSCHVHCSVLLNKDECPLQQRLNTQLIHWPRSHVCTHLNAQILSFLSFIITRNSWNQLQPSYRYVGCAQTTQWIDYCRSRKCCTQFSFANFVIYCTFGMTATNSANYMICSIALAVIVSQNFAQCIIFKTMTLSFLESIANPCTHPEVGIFWRCIYEG